MMIIVRIPGLAADDYDGGEVGQNAMFGHHLRPGCPDRTLVQAWAEAGRVRSGKGHVRIVHAYGPEDVRSMMVAFEALYYGARDSEEHSLARALATAAERCRVALAGVPTAPNT